MLRFGELTLGFVNPPFGVDGVNLQMGTGVGGIGAVGG